MKMTGVNPTSALQQLPADFTPRLWSKDAALWKTDEAVQASIRNRLGWLDLPEDMLKVAGFLKVFAADIRRAGFTHMILLGMGGSSLAPEVLRLTFGAGKEGLKLFVLDTTDPGQILEAEKAAPLKKTLFIVSSKSGGTIEVMSLFKYFFAKVEKLKKEKAGEHFVAVTDPNTSLEKLAREKGFRRVFTTPEDVGGRFSALTYFGLVPAALLGVDVGRLLERAAGFARACGPEVPAEHNEPLLIGSALGLLGKAGRDKVTFVLSKEISSFGLWAEQLIAESTGKEGRGLVPVEGEELLAPKAYGNDRVFVSLAVGGRHPASLKGLEAAGHPVVRVDLSDRYDLGREFFRWEMATAVAGAVLGVNPFDEPNVSESKANTSRILAQYEASGHLPEETPLLKTKSIAVWADKGLSQDASLQDAVNAHLARGKSGDYVALMAYITNNPAHHRALLALRKKIQSATGLATTLGYGPRFLHSTGQLHKGGDDNGLFIQVTAQDAKDLSVPGTSYGFATLKMAQALGDFQAIKEHSLRGMRLHLSKVTADLAVVAKMVRIPSKGALSKKK
jgi:glucose-6-phosphate isomerase